MSKEIEPGSYVLLRGKIAEIVGIINDPAVTIRYVESGEEETHVIGCPNYKEYVKPVKTIKEEE